MDDTLTKAATHKLVGGALCLDFVNTLGTATSDQPTEYLPTYAALVVWSEHAGLLTPADTAHLIAQATQRPADGRTALQNAQRLRAVLHHLFVAVAQGTVPPAEDLALLNTLLAIAAGQTRVMPTSAGYAWTWADDPNALDRMLWPVVRSAAEMLVTGDAFERGSTRRTIMPNEIMIENTDNHIFLLSHKPSYRR
jgi:predicted RNA-binding Zn ribbon-like protein